MRVDRVVVERVRRAAAADGAGESGLSALLGAHALQAAGDALVTVALAGTVFFSVPLGQARGRVALYLLLTLLPFSLLVPVAGPVLDRFRHGRRNVLAITAAARGLVAWSMAGLTASLGLYPLALAVLVLSRAFGVARSAATPRVRPDGVSLVAANARLNVAGVLSASVAAALGAAVAKVVGIGWVLRLASVVLLAGAVCAVRLPAQIDEARAPRVKGLPRYRLLQAPPEVQRPLVAAVSLRALAGLLTIFLAFLLKGEGAANAVIGIVLGAAVVGQLVGTALAGRLPARVTARLTLASLIVPAGACLAAAVLGGSELFALAAGLSGVSYSLSKFALDASLQTHVPLESTSGAFSRSETGLQLAWAAGGGLAVAVPTIAAVGFGLAAALPVFGVVAGARAAAGSPLLPQRRPAPAEGGPVHVPWAPAADPYGADPYGADPGGTGSAFRAEPGAGSTGSGDRTFATPGYASTAYEQDDTRTLHLDTLNRDTLHRDTVDLGALHLDTLNRDTLHRDTVDLNTLRPDTLQPDEAPTRDLELDRPVSSPDPDGQRPWWLDP